jgi:hemerythrin
MTSAANEAAANQATASTATHAATDLDWNDDMDIDHSGLDVDHRRQLELVRRFIGLTEATDRAMALEALEELRTVSARHFAREERIQASIRYPELDEHRDQHQRLLSLLVEVAGRIADAAPPPAYTEVKTLANEQLRSWFHGHFSGADLRLRHHLARFGVR